MALFELIDTHCHLDADPMGADPVAVLSRARQAGVHHVVVPAYDIASWDRIAELAGSHGENVHPAFGLHPWVADQPLDLERLRKMLQDKQAVAVGEIGLDLKIDQPGRARQIEVLTAQLRLALELDLPVILHCRGGFEEMLDILGRHRPRLRGVVHAYSRGPELAERFVDLGLLLGFGGAITRPRARRARRSAETAPLEWIVLETDAPSIGLHDVEPAKVEPRHIAPIAAALAEIRNTSTETVAEVTTANAKRLFGIV